MAIFNPQQPEQASDYTRYSQGVRPDTSGSTLLEGITQGINTGLKAGEDWLKGLIRADATEGVDQLRDREINQGAREQGYRVAESPTATQQIDPVAKKAIDQNAARVGLAKEAAKTGQIGDSHYQLLLDAEARRLRARYPGYREYIDNVISDLTGGTPANKAIELMKAEANKGAPKEDAQLNNEYHWAREHGGPGQEALGRGEQPTLDQMRKWNYTHAKQLSDAKLITATLGADKTQIDANRERNFNTIGNHVLGRLQSSFTATQEGMGVEWKAVQAEVAKAGEAIAAGRPVSAETEAQTREALNTFERNRMEDFNKMMLTQDEKTGLTWAQAIGPAKVDELRKTYQEQIKAQIDPILNKDTSRIRYNVAKNEAMTEEAVLKMRNSSSYANNLNAARKLIGDQVLNSMHYQSTGGLDAAQVFYKESILNEAIASGNFTDPSKKIEQIMKESGKSDTDIAKTKGAAMDAALKAIRDPKTPPAAVDKISAMMFSGDPVFKDFYAQASYADKRVLFQRMVDPKITDSIFKTNNPEVTGRYTKWVDAVVGQRMLQSAADVRDTVINTDSTTGLQYDPKTQQFSPIIRERQGSAPKGSNLDAGEQALRNKTARVSMELNTTINHWRPVAEKLGVKPEDMNETITRLFKANGLDVNNMVYKGQ